MSGNRDGELLEGSSSVGEGLEETPSLEDTIRQNWRSINERQGDETASTSASQTDASQAQSITPASTESAGSRGQGQQSANPAITTADPAQESQAIAPQVKAAPNSWTKEAKAHFSTLAPEVQEAVLKREDDFHRGIDSYREKAQLADRFEKVLTPHLQTIQSLGISPDVAVSELLNADRVLRYSHPVEKAQYMMSLIQQYGVDLSLLQQAAQQHSQSVSNPVHAQQRAYDPQINSLSQTVSQLQNKLNQQEAERQQSEERALHSHLQEFAKSNPHFSAVREGMAALIQAGQAKDLQEAYDMAIYANPETRAQVLAQQQADAEAKRAEEARKAVKNARRSNGVNVPKKGSLPSSNAQSVGTMEDTIRASAASLGLF